MDPKQFDKLAASVGRRTILGGALAGILGLGTATLADAAKGKVAGKKKTKQRVGKEVICTGPGANPLLGQCPVGTCCVPTGPTQPVSCLTPAQQTTAFCGNGNTGGPCIACPTGTRCVAGSCVCDATTCQNGCCTTADPVTGRQQCIQNGSGQAVQTAFPGIPAGSFVCGTGGGICNVCSTGGQTFSGCCTAQGACIAGTAGSNCGTSGLTCQVCTVNQTCGLNQQCSNNFAPPVPPVPPAPAPAPVCGSTQRLCGGICVDILNNNLNCGACNFVCGGRKRCSGGTCRRPRRRRRGGRN